MIVLCIDDDPDDTDFFCEALRTVSPDSQCLVANDGLTALKTLRTDCLPDIIFLDINMPRMDGFGFLNELESIPDPAIKKCSVAMLISSHYPDDKVKAMRSPFVKYFFNKPLTDEILREINIQDRK